MKAIRLCPRITTNPVRAKHPVIQKQLLFHPSKLHVTNSFQSRLLVPKRYISNTRTLYFTTQNQTSKVDYENYVNHGYQKDLSDLSKKSDALPHIRMAYSLQELGRWEDSLEYLDKAESINPEQTFIYSSRIAAYENIIPKDRNKSAREIDLLFKDYDKLISLEPDVAHWYSARAAHRMNFRRDVKGAMEDFEQAIQLGLSFANSYIAYANLCLVTNQPTKAIEVLDKGINGGFITNPEDIAELHSAKSELLEIQKKPSASFTEIEKSLQHSPNDPVLHAKKVDSLLDNKKFGEALQAIHKWMEIPARSKEDAAEPYVARAILNNMQGTFQKAVSDCDEALQLVPDHVVALANRAEAYEALREHHKAIQDYEAVVKSPNSPRDMQVHSLCAAASNLAALKEYDKALEFVNRGIALDESVASGYKIRAKIYLDKDQIDNALSDATTYVEKAGTADAYINRCFIYTRKDNVKSALEDLEQAVKLDELLCLQLVPSLYLALGNLSAANRKFKEAILYFTKDIETNPQPAQALVSRAKCYYNLNQHGFALTDVNKAIQLEPNQYDFYITRAFIYTKIDLKGQAVDDFNKAVELNPDDKDVRDARDQFLENPNVAMEAPKDQPKKEEEPKIMHMNFSLPLYEDTGSISINKT